jgi:hypothetical protein
VAIGSKSEIDQIAISIVEGQDDDMLQRFAKVVEKL